MTMVAVLLQRDSGGKGDYEVLEFGYTTVAEREVRFENWEES
jgi:hypothetical protein